MAISDYIGDDYQLYGAKRYSLSEGKAKGMEFIHLKNGNGLELDVSLNRNGDISSLSYRGVNLSYLSSCGYVDSTYYDSKGAGFLKSFTGGFLTTCGLTTFGTPSFDGEDLPLHGTISNIPVSNSSYEVLDNAIVIKTLTKDETIFSHKLTLSREIILDLKRNAFKIKDHVENRGDLLTPLMVLYHMNLGYPLLDENLCVYINKESVKGRTEQADETIASALTMEKPQRGYIERCYYHEMKKNAFACVYNKKLGFGLKISYDKAVLPSFTEWKMMGVRDYVLGLEPGTNFPDGRAEIKKQGKLGYLKPGESKEFEIDVEIIENQETYQQFTKE